MIGFKKIIICISVLFMATTANISLFAQDSYMAHTSVSSGYGSVMPFNYNCPDSENN